MEESRKYGIVKLGDDNYHVWQQRTELWLRKEDLWDVIEDTAPATPDAAWSKRDRQARATIGLLIEDKFLTDIKHEKTAWSAWHKLQQIHSHNTLGSRLLLYRKIFSAKYSPGQSMVDHITGILEAASKLEDAGYKLLDELVCSALLGSLPREFDVLITTIEGRAASDITIDYVREKILEEFRKKDKVTSEPTHDTRALYTQNRPPRTKPNNMKCFYCHKVGHVRRDCRLLKNHSAHEDYTQKTHDNPREQAKLADLGTRDALSRNYSSETRTTEPDTTVYRALNTTIDNKNSNPGNWIIDTGAADHMCHTLEKMSNITKIKTNITVITASGEKYAVDRKGDCVLDLVDRDNQEQQIVLQGVLYVPDLTEDLLSITRFDTEGYEIRFTKQESWLVKDNTQMLLGRLKDKLYVHETKFMENGEKANLCQHIWHDRLGHRNQEDIDRMEKEDMTKGLNYSVCNSKGICVPCTMCKMTNAPFLSTHKKSYRPFQMIYSDLCGPITPASLGHNSYVLSITDNFSKYSITYLLRNKDQTTDKIVEYIERGITKFGHKPEVFFSDGGGEYANHTLDTYLSRHGIRHNTSLPHTPQENGASERFNRTLMETARTLMKQAKLPDGLWGEMVGTSTYLLNLVGHRNLKCTPYELWNGHKPQVNHLKTIGTKCFFWNPLPNKHKLQDRGIPGVLIGYGNSLAFYRIWHSESNRIYQSRKVVFPEEKCPHLEQALLPITENIYTDIKSDGEEQEENIAPCKDTPRRSNRDTKGRAPRILTYEKMGEASPDYQDWFKNHNGSYQRQPASEH